MNDTDKKFGFGFSNIDRRLNIEEGDLVVIASRPSVGKTSLALNICLNRCEEGNSIGYYTLEGKKEKAYNKLYSYKTSIPLISIINDDLDDNQKVLLTNAKKSLDSKRLNIVDGVFTVEHLLNRIKKDHIIKNYDTVFIDYMQMAKSSTNVENRYLEMNELSRGLKQLAMELDIVVIATSELNRSVENRLDKRPFLNDLRDSGTIEDDADVILFIYRDDIYKERLEAQKEKEANERGERYVSKYNHKPIEDTEIIVAKNRIGAKGTIKLDFQKHTTKFLNKELFDMPIDIVYEREETISDMPNI